MSPCHLVLLTLSVMVSFLHQSRSSTASLKLRQIHPLHRVYFLDPPLHRTASFSFSLSVCQHHNLFHTMHLLSSHGQRTPTSILLLCFSDISPLACPISISFDSFVLFSVQETISILLHIHISQASIVFSIAIVFVHVSQLQSITGKIIAFRILVIVCRLTCLYFHIFQDLALPLYQA